MKIAIVFDGPPEHFSGRFVEVENEAGESINAGTWEEMPNGWWRLWIDNSAAVAAARAEWPNSLYLDAEYARGQRDERERCTDIANEHACVDDDCSCCSVIATAIREADHD
jgi:hypothetical protein